MGQFQMSYPKKLVTAQVTPAPAVQQTATGPAPVANNYKKVDDAAMREALGQIQAKGGFFRSLSRADGSLRRQVHDQLRTNGYEF